MAAYWIARARIGNPNEKQREALRKYADIVVKLSEIHPFETLSRSANTEILEGTTHFDQYYLHKFPSMEAAKAFYYSSEYQEAVTIRRACFDSEIVIIDGIDALTLP